MFLLFSPHGVIPDAYWPTGSETAFNFPAGGILEPLAAHKGDMVIYKGLKRDTRGPGDHERCFCNMWTGTALAPGTQEANGPSIDQIVAKAIKPTTAFESLQFSVQPHYTSDTDSTSRAGPLRRQHDLRRRQAAHPLRVQPLQDVRPPVRRHRRGGMQCRAA